MLLLRPATLLGACLLGATLTVPVAAQDTLASPSFKPAATKPKAAKSAAASSNKERRPGELEGFESGLKGNTAPRSKAPPDAIGERRLPDGGLPLPRERDNSPGMAQSPVGFDKNGNMGGMFKF